jgi:hypothetical protein
MPCVGGLGRSPGDIDRIIEERSRASDRIKAAAEETTGEVLPQVRRTNGAICTVDSASDRAEPSGEACKPSASSTRWAGPDPICWKRSRKAGCRRTGPRSRTGWSRSRVGKDWELRSE